MLRHGPRQRPGRHDRRDQPRPAPAQGPHAVQPLLHAADPAAGIRPGLPRADLRYREYRAHASAVQRGEVTRIILMMTPNLARDIAWTARVALPALALGAASCGIAPHD